MMYLTYVISYIMSDRELCYFISKPIGDEKEIIKSFMAFNIALRKPNYGSTNNPPHDDALATQTHESNTFKSNIQHCVLQAYF